MERLDKVLVSQNIGSRKEIAQLCRKGLVRVNHDTVRKPDLKVDPETDTIEVNGQTVVFERYVYYMLNKPAGVLSASRDSRAETVLDLLPEELIRPELFPAGRLDKDTEGLLILTNDGQFAHRMLHPKRHVEKEYLAEVSSPLGESDIEAFAQGIMLDDLQCRPARLRILDGTGCFVSITVSEGKFHQVKRMVSACGSEVLKLKRIRIGSLILDEALSPGQVRIMSENEQKAVFQPFQA